MADRADAFAIFLAWIRLEHAGARRRSGISFRAALDMQDLWRWIGAEGESR